jgi:hypothetical protein
VEEVALPSGLIFPFNTGLKLGEESLESFTKRVQGLMDQISKSIPPPLQDLHTQVIKHENSKDRVSILSSVPCLEHPVFESLVLV